MVAVTHCDKLVGYPGYGASSGWAEFADGVRNRPLLRQLALVLDGAPQKQIAVGSLGSMEAAIKFLSDIFKKLGLVQ